MADLSSAKAKIDHVLINWFHDDAIMLGVWCLVDKLPDTKQKTIGIDSKTYPPVIRYNPNFINSLHTEHLEAVMASEGLKLLLKHPTTRLLQPKHISGLSSSITINQMLSGRNVFDDLKECFPEPNNFGLEDGKFFEEYFRNLMDQKTDVEDKIQEIWNSMSTEEKQEALDNASANGSGEGNSDADSNDNTDSDGYQKYDKPNDALKDYYDPNGTTNDEWGSNNLFDADVQNMVQNNKGSMKNWGKHTADYLAEIVAANTPKISWVEIVKRFNNSVVDVVSTSSRLKVNRRYDLDSPGYRRKYRCKIAFFVDVSGSMSDKMLQNGFAVINSVCKHAEITYGTFDTEIKQVEHKFKKAKSFKVLGRGGTDTQCVIDYVNNHKYDGVVIFSDMYFSRPTKPKNTKVLWLCTAKDQKPPVEWGYVAKLDMYESNY